MEEGPTRALGSQPCYAIRRLLPSARRGFLLCTRQASRIVRRVTEGVSAQPQGTRIPLRNLRLERAPFEGNTARAMSEERLELVRGVYEAASARELPFDLFTSHSEADFQDASPDQGVVQGPEAGWTELLKYIDMFDGFHVELYDVIHADQDTVVTEARDGGRAKGRRRGGPQPLLSRLQVPWRQDHSLVDPPRSEPSPRSRRA
jgi:hypothetical protein